MGVAQSLSDLVGLGLLPLELGCILLMKLVLTRLETGTVVLLKEPVRAAELAVAEGAVANHSERRTGASLE